MKTPRKNTRQFRLLARRSSWNFSLRYPRAYCSVRGLMIVGVACIQVNTGIMFTLPKPYRHHNVMHKYYDDHGKVMGENNQGFILANGRYVDRKVAYWIAKHNRQFNRRDNNPIKELFSEDIW